jgi:hypothetical protein
MTNMHPTGLTQNFAQSWRPLPTDVTFTIVLFTAFMAGRCQAHKFADLATAAEAAGISYLGPIDHRRYQANAGLLHQLVNDCLMSERLGQLLEGLLDAIDLGFNER